MLAVQLLKHEKTKDGKGEEGPAAKSYARFLAHLLKQPVLVLVLTILIIAGTTFFYNRLASDFLPVVDEGSYVLDYLAPAGASLQDVDNLAKKLEAIVARTKEVATWTRRTGAELGLFATQTNKGDILVVLKPAGQRKRSADQIMEAQRQEITAAFPQLDVDFHQ